MDLREKYEMGNGGKCMMKHLIICAVHRKLLWRYDTVKDMVDMYKSWWIWEYQEF
jgi:hypothetical protein